jgi:hypothetical protein
MDTMFLISKIIRLVPIPVEVTSSIGAIFLDPHPRTMEMKT